MSTKPFKIRSLPGIKRDGTRFEGENYIDGQWVRFQRGLPRKMFGYRALVDVLERVYGMNTYSQGGSQYIHVGSANALQQVVANSQGILTGINLRTPAAPFVASPDNVWQFDIMFDSVGVANQIIAHPGQNLSEIDNATETNIFAGQVNGAGILTATGMDPQSGGVVVLHPYLLTFGNFGRVDVSAPGDFSAVDDSAFVTGSKIVRGMTLRGSGNGGPSGLLWSLDSLIRATFANPPTSADPTFLFDTVADDISILSSRSVMAYDGLYLWAGVDRFLMFNGVVREIPNNMSINWFFDNLNFSQRQKVFAYKVPRFGEIWWCFPFGNATECTHALIYNIRENTWYDTLLPETGRSDGIFAKVYNKPFMVGTQLTSSPGYTLWQHETGLDAINGSAVNPIQSYFETGEITVLTDEREPQDATLRIERIEGDFVQVGDISVTVIGRPNAKATETVAETQVIPETPATPSEQTSPFKTVRRLMSFKFETNSQGGDMQMGDTLGFIEPDGQRYT